MEKNFIPVSKNLLTDPKIQALAEVYGTAGAVGHWVLTLLSLYGNSGAALESEGIMGLSQARLHGFSLDELQEFYDYCARVKLIDDLLWQQKKQVFNTGVFDHVMDCKRKAEALSNAGRKGGKKSSNKQGLSEA